MRDDKCRLDVRKLKRNVMEVGKEKDAVVRVPQSGRVGVPMRLLARKNIGAGDLIVISVCKLLERTSVQIDEKGIGEE